MQEKPGFHGQRASDRSRVLLVDREVRKQLAHHPWGLSRTVDGWRR